MHEKFSEVQTLPLFPDLIPPQPTRGGESQRATAAFARASCPRCQNTNVGLYVDGRHLRWRVHYLYRGTGPSTPCSASGVHLCVLAPRAGEYVLANVHDGGTRRRPAQCGCGS